MISFGVMASLAVLAADSLLIWLWARRASGMTEDEGWALFFLIVVWFAALSALSHHLSR